MADTKTSAETDATVLTGTEQVRIVQSASSKKTTAVLLSHHFRGAKVRMNADDTAQNYTTETAIPFDVADFDTDSFWSGGAPTKLTIPAGVTYVSLVGQVYSTSSTGDTSGTVSIQHLNSSDTLLNHYGFRLVEFGSTVKMAQASTGPVAVTATDYFTLMYREETDSSVTIEGNDTGQTFLSLTVLGMAP